MKKFKGCYIWYLILSLLFIAAGVLLFPNLTNLGWGERLIDLLVGVALLVYFIAVIIPSLEHFGSKHTEIKILTLVETVLVAFLMVASVLSFFDIMTTLPINIVVGGALWLRGTCLVVGAVHGRKSRFGAFGKYLYILLISLGIWVVFSNLITDKVILTSLCVVLFIAALILLIYSVKYWPKKTKEQKQAMKKQKAAKKAAKQKQVKTKEAQPKVEEKPAEETKTN